MVQHKVTQRKKTSSQPTVARMVEDVVGCKWSLAVLESVRKGVIRPGEIQRSIPEISTKVLNERLSKMVRYGILVRQSYSEVPPRVEYTTTEFGDRFVSILEQIEMLQSEASSNR